MRSTHSHPGTIKFLMNKLFLILLFNLSIFWGCTKDTPIVTPAPVEPTHLIGLDSIMFKRNGQVIKTKGNVSYFNNVVYSVVASKRIVGGHSLAELLSIQKIPINKGIYKIGNFDPWGTNPMPFGNIYWSVEDVVVGKLQTVDRFPDDYIEVIEADTVAKTVEGRFQFHLINIESQYLEEYGLPDSLNITEGVFYLKLQ